VYFICVVARWRGEKKIFICFYLIRSLSSICLRLADVYTPRLLRILFILEQLFDQFIVLFYLLIWFDAIISNQRVSYPIIRTETIQTSCPKAEPDMLVWKFFFLMD
jgi:hypothetical protein